MNSISNHVQTLPARWKKAATLTLGLGLLLGGFNTQAATDCNAVTEISTVECESLLELYHSTNGAHWKNNGRWNVTNTPCGWYGVSCENGGVTKIRLDENQLTGAIPDFSALPNLEYFSFSGNQLTLMCNAVTQISKVECESLLELYHSTNGAQWKNNEGWNVTNTPCSWYGVSCENGGVTEIRLTYNQLTGAIPDFSALPKLQKLELYNNQLTGAIPDFSALPKLEKLDLPGNQLTGAIPNFSALPNLHALYLHKNQLTGTIPDLSALPNLQVLSLSNNQLTGAIPDFSALPKLERLDLDSNQLTGAIPDFSALPNLEYFSFSGNQLTLMNTNCNAVTQISKVECESLLELYHSTNGAEWKNSWNVTNTPCSWYGVSCENGGVTEISLSSNRLMGAIPDFSALPKLQKLDLPGNQLTGAIPDFSALPNLQTLSLYRNQLTGAIPDFSALPNLQWLALDENQLTGAIPDFSALSNLQELWLFANQLTGAIPDFSALPNLKTLYLDNNQLTGAIPDFSALTELEYLDLRNNSICKDTNINYASWPIKQAKHWPAKDKVEATWQEELDGFPNCPVNPLSATVKMLLNQSRYTTGNPLHLDMEVNGKAKVDLYVAIVFPDGTFITIAYPFGISWPNTIQVYQPNVEIAGQKTYAIMGFPLPGDIAKGQYQAYGVLVTAGTDPHDQNNWIHLDYEEFEVY